MVTKVSTIIVCALLALFMGGGVEWTSNSVSVPNPWTALIAFLVSFLVCSIISFASTPGFNKFNN